MPPKANTKKTLQDPSPRNHSYSNSHTPTPTPHKKSKTSHRNPPTPPASIYTIESTSDSEYSNHTPQPDDTDSTHTSPSEYAYSTSYSSPTSLHAPETPSLESYHETLDAQIIEYFHSHPDKPYLQSQFQFQSQSQSYPTPSSHHSLSPSSPLSPSSHSHSNSHSHSHSSPNPPTTSSSSPLPPNQLPLTSLSHLDQHLYNKLLRSRRYGHLAQRAHENELARQKLTDRISLLNIELREKGEEMKKLVVQELSEEQGVREEAMPSWMGEVLYWGGWDEGCVGFWEGWEGYWERFFREEGQLGERGEGRVKGRGVWKRWGRGIKGVFGSVGKRRERGEDYEMV